MKALQKKLKIIKITKNLQKNFKKHESKFNMIIIIYKKFSKNEKMKNYEINNLNMMKNIKKKYIMYYFELKYM